MSLSILSLDLIQSISALVTNTQNLVAMNGTCKRFKQVTDEALSKRAIYYAIFSQTICYPVTDRRHGVHSKELEWTENNHKQSFDAYFTGRTMFIGRVFRRKDINGKIVREVMTFYFRPRNARSGFVQIGFDEGSERRHMELSYRTVEFVRGAVAQLMPKD